MKQIRRRLKKFKGFKVERRPPYRRPLTPKIYYWSVDRKAVWNRIRRADGSTQRLVRHPYALEVRRICELAKNPDEWMVAVPRKSNASRADTEKIMRSLSRYFRRLGYSAEVLQWAHTNAGICINWKETVGEDEATTQREEQ